MKLIEEMEVSLKLHLNNQTLNTKLLRELNKATDIMYILRFLLCSFYLYFIHCTSFACFWFSFRFLTPIINTSLKNLKWYKKLNLSRNFEVLMAFLFCVIKKEVLSSIEVRTYAGGGGTWKHTGACRGGGMPKFSVFISYVLYLWPLMGIFYLMINTDNFFFISMLKCSYSFTYHLIFQVIPLYQLTHCF